MMLPNYSCHPSTSRMMDQTVLDNSSYNADIVRARSRHSRQSHANRCRDTTASAIPGAREFLDYAASRGVTVIYNSARTEDMRECTARNLRALGFPFPDQKLLLLSDGTTGTKKVRQRDRVCRQYRILLLIGDDLNDFVAGPETDPDTCRALASRHADHWGRQWIILPNPMYGHWERALYGYDDSLTEAERLQLKLRYLQH